MRGWQIGALTALMMIGVAQADSVTVDIYRLNNDEATKGMGEKIGVIVFSDSDRGLEIKPDVSGLTPGLHGFHIHEKPSCERGEKDNQWQAGMAAGGHYDPAQTGKHLGPKGKGHQGDMPALEVGKDGKATKSLLAPHLNVVNLHRRSVMIHEGGDNYADTPNPLGGGGARIACGVIP